MRCRLAATWKYLPQICLFLRFCSCNPVHIPHWEKVYKLQFLALKMSADELMEALSSYYCGSFSWYYIATVQCHNSKCKEVTGLLFGMRAVGGQSQSKFKCVHAWRGRIAVLRFLPRLNTPASSSGCLNILHLSLFLFKWAYVGKKSARRHVRERQRSCQGVLAL